MEINEHFELKFLEALDLDPSKVIFETEFSIKDFRCLFMTKNIFLK